MTGRVQCLLEDFPEICIKRENVFDEFSERKGRSLDGTEGRNQGREERPVREDSGRRETLDKRKENKGMEVPGRHTLFNKSQKERRVVD